MKVNADRNGMEPRRQQADNIDNHLVTSAPKTAPNVMTCILFTLSVQTIQWAMWSGQCMSASSPAPQRDHSCFTTSELQEKESEQVTTQYIAFFYLSKSFNLVNKKYMLQLLKKIDCPAHLLIILISFHMNIQAISIYDSETSVSFKIKIQRETRMHSRTDFVIFLYILLTSLSASLNCCCTKVHPETRW